MIDRLRWLAARAAVEQIEFNVTLSYMVFEHGLCAVQDALDSQTILGRLKLALRRKGIIQ